MSFTETDDKKLLQPYDYILQITGKQIRTKLIEAFNHWFQIPDDKLRTISEIVEMLHNASLLCSDTAKRKLTYNTKQKYDNGSKSFKTCIDDIEDNSILRRGIPVAHNIFGIASTINAANYVYFLSLDKAIKELPSELTPKVVRIFTDQLLELHRGQGLDIYWRDSFICPTEEQYLDMIRKKTGGLFGLGVRLMQLFSNDERNYANLISLLGTYFQIRDDYSNLKSNEYEENKSYCEDLTEGKFSFPIVHAIKTKPEDSTLINIIRQRPKNREIKKFAVDLLDKFGSFIYTINTMQNMDLETRREIEVLGGNPYLSKLMDHLKFK